ncbi:IS200/IS605 family transposase [Mucilaginibacter celer]|uniref:IS200/IS605 family transposase n=1 Tax=Mucilaginibacter celer TaxID=2305508 RepID=A0A494VSF8_9SPHI|nr:IS200/IS605 family transposase [Mucilaginibacter celer]AYL96991.1 IS200/IS605 family transposase [Mucilaginibacter celer]
MASNNTYTQLYVHIVFAVKFRLALIDDSWAERLRMYISSIVQNQGHKLVAINNMPDHLHLFIGHSPNQSLVDLVRIVKSDSSEWINKEKLTKSKFKWQEGYGAFTHSRSQVDKVVKYISNQQEHHKKKTLAEEFRKILKGFDVEFDERFIFKPLE